MTRNVCFCVFFWPESVFPRLYYFYLFKAGCGRSETVTEMKLAGKDSRLEVDGSRRDEKGKALS